MTGFVLCGGGVTIDELRSALYIYIYILHIFISNATPEVLHEIVCVVWGVTPGLTFVSRGVA